MAPVYKNFIYNAERGFIFAYVPKVACTNWKSLLRYMAGQEDWLDNKRAHDKVNGGLRYLDSTETALLDDPSIRRYAMVRDPYSRVLSGYLNKVESRLPVKPQGTGDHFDTVVRDIEIFRRMALGDDRFPEISFEVFLHWLKAGTSPYVHDEHWAPQVLLLRQPDMPFDILGRFENLPEDSARMLAAMGCDQRFPSQKDVNFAPTKATDKIARYYDISCYALVSEIFAEDFAAFDYETHAEATTRAPAAASTSLKVQPNLAAADRPVRAVVPGLETDPTQAPIGTRQRIPLAPAHVGNDASDLIQSQLDAAGLQGGGTVLLSAGRYRISKTLVLPANVILEGVGEATEIFLNDGSNTTLVETIHFDAFSGSNSWFADEENVPTGFGVRNLALNGNRKANIKGCGVRFFGKRFIVNNVHISEIAETGFYSECGNKVGQSSRLDMPECIIDSLWVSFVKGHGVQYRGPHDGIMNNVLVSRAGKRGISIEFKAGEYDGSVDADMWHAYGCGQEGIFLGAKVNSGTRLTGENCAREGIVLSGTKACNLSSISAFDNCKAKASHKKPDVRPETGAFNIRIDEDFHTINGIRIYDRVDCFGGIHLKGSKVLLSGVMIDGNSKSNGSGIFLEGSSNIITGLVQKFGGANGVGLETNGNLDLNKIELVLNDNRKAWKNKAKLIGNGFDLSIRATEQQSLFSGVVATGQNDLKLKAIWGERLLQTEGIYRSANQGRYVDMTTAQEQIIEMVHDLALLPGTRSGAHFTLETDAADYSVAYMSLLDWTAETFRVKVKLDRPAPSGKGSVIAQLKV